MMSLAEGAIRYTGAWTTGVAVDYSPFISVLHTTMANAQITKRSVLSLVSDVADEGRIDGPFYSYVWRC